MNGGCPRFTVSGAWNFESSTRCRGVKTEYSVLRTRYKVLTKFRIGSAKEGIAWSVNPDIIPSLERRPIMAGARTFTELKFWQRARALGKEIFDASQKEP